MQKKKKIVNAILSFRWLFWNISPKNDMPTLLLGILFIVLGVQIFSIGLLGEMTVKFNQTTNNLSENVKIYSND